MRAHGARLIGPNCLGIAVAGPRLNATFAARGAPSGAVGFSSQSGALGLALLEAAEARGLGLSAFVSIGNKADVSTNDLLEYWEDDDATRLVLLYVESFGNPRTLRPARAPRRAQEADPRAQGRASPRRASARPARTRRPSPGSDAAANALFHQAGVIRAGSLEELVDTATLLVSQPQPHGRRVGVLTNAGGLGILCADACEAAGLELPGPGRAHPPAARGAPARRGQPRQPGGHARLGDRGRLRGRPRHRPRGSAARRGDRPLRARRHRQRRRGVGGDPPRARVRARRRQARAGGRGRGRGDPADPSGRGLRRRRVHLSRAGRARARTSRRARRMAATARGLRARARPRRPGRGRRGRRAIARRGRRSLARARRGA